MNILVSFVMSVYNAENYIKESIDSILSQDYFNFELIIINDGSNDQSLDIVKNYANFDKRIKYFSIENSGLASALNYGISKASGDWIARIDADDLCNKDRLSRFYFFLKLHPEAKLFYSNSVSIDKDGNILSKHSYSRFNFLIKFFMIVGGPVFPHSSVFFNKKFFYLSGKYRKFFLRSQDRDLWLRFIDHSRLHHIPEYLVKIRVHEFQLSNTSNGHLQRKFYLIAVTNFLFKKFFNFDMVTQDPEGLLKIVKSRLDNSKYFLKSISLRADNIRNCSFINIVSCIKKIFLKVSFLAKNMFIVIRLFIDCYFKYSK